MAQFFLDKESSATIGFVVASAFAGAIDRSEIQAWADYVLVTAEKYPLYIVDLSTFDGPLTHLYEIIGFAPGSRLSDNERDALVGIAWLRGREGSDRVAREDALATLATHPQVLVRFRDTFPFIPVSDPSSAEPGVPPHGGPATSSDTPDEVGGRPSVS